ncbi:hypothetical protein DY023_16915 [Microbacterium bovistercoris]|uniref:DUF4337 domain-containing protein n=1 Tax=Microbacterium bovistercoris TaxID=2293570 RepID=A0A371NP79_9MICO|nr:hypothetical protein [Microbacterium bovistercoris]REJ03994.1 hypothetical protein DY023_16915 [Microbacterium bovistercoris]
MGQIEKTRVRKKRDVFDVIAVFVLSVTAVLTAWCGFEASKWGGDMSIAFSQASSARVQATAAEGEARDARQYDLTIWTQYVLAEADGNTQLVGYIEQRFTPEFRVAFDAWDADGRVEQGPFVVPEYVPPGTEEAKQLSERADAKFQQALESNQRGDNYTLLTVLFALVLFLTAMSQRDLVSWARWTLLSLAMVVGAAGIVIMLTFPILI